HLTSSQFEKIEDALQLGLHVVVSTHSINEIKKLSQHNIFAFTFSPIFATPNKGKPKGISELQKAITCSDKKIVALGGIVDNTHIDLIRKTNAFGFASIRYFL
ncbi:MAG: thiamine phosphate synthase, partial [Campylobacterota bacterium]|nr:thiamine phosphate synthase [Campylobacterota bacterium]